MNTARSIIIVIMVLFGLAYLGEAQKAVLVKKARLGVAYNDGKITQEQYTNALKDISLGRMLLDPKFSLSVD